MIRYIIKKLMYGFLVLFGAITVIFFLFHIKPGDPARMLSGQMVNEDILKTKVLMTIVGGEIKYRK